MVATSDHHIGSTRKRLGIETTTQDIGIDKNQEKQQTYDCIYGSAIVDTGASTNLISNEFGKYLCQTKASTACIQGFEGSNEIKGNTRGVGHLYILGVSKESPGFQLSTNFDTIDGLNSNLFSISSLYEDHNFSLKLRSKMDMGGKCELTRESPCGLKQSIPIMYDKTRSAFMIRFVMGKDRKRVVERGMEIERRLGMTLVENMKIGNQSSLCPSRISRMGVVLYTSTNTRGISWGGGTKHPPTPTHLA